MCPLHNCPALFHKLHRYPAWRASTNPVFIPLGGRPRTQYLSRLAAIQEPSIYPAWRASANPVFIPLDSHPRTQDLSRLAAIQEPSIYPAWQPSANPVFIPLGGRSGTQYLSRLATFYATSALCTPLSDHTARMLPAGSRKWKRRPPGKLKISCRIVPPAAMTAL